MISRKSIRVVMMVAALFALLTGCGNDDDEKPNGGHESLGGHVGKNPFKGLTIVSENHGGTDTYTFTSDTKGVYKRQRTAWYYQEDFEYAVDSDRNMLKLRITSHTEDGETLTLNDKYLAETYGNLDDETKSVLYDSFIEYVHYDFADDDTVVLDSDYYFGSMAESRADFEFYDNASGVDFSISNITHFYIDRENDFSQYTCYPKFANDGSFTAVVFKPNKAYTKYEKLSTTLAGTCQIISTGTDGFGTVTFTQIPDEMKADDDGKGLALNKTYQLKQYNEPDLYTIQK